MKKETECSETLAFKLQTPLKHPEENIQRSENGESLKSNTFDWLCRDKGQFQYIVKKLSIWWDKNCY
jgi:hypothetical protein